MVCTTLLSPKSSELKSKGHPLERTSNIFEPDNLKIVVRLAKKKLLRYGWDLMNGY